METNPSEPSLCIYKINTTKIQSSHPLADKLRSKSSLNSEVPTYIFVLRKRNRPNIILSTMYKCFKVLMKQLKLRYY